MTVLSSQGPRAYKIAKDADVTVILFKDIKVTANRSFRKGELTAAYVDSILADLVKITPAPRGKKP